MADEFLKIGFSLGRCVRDIVTGKVDAEQVVVIIARTRIETTKQLDFVIYDYAFKPGYLEGLDIGQCQQVAQMLWSTGRLHQPRVVGNLVSKVPEEYVWMNLIPHFHAEDPVVAYALRNYIMTVKLVSDRANSMRGPF